MNSEQLQHYAQEVGHRLRRKHLYSTKVTIYVDRRTLMDFRRDHFNAAHAGLDRVQADRNVWVSWAADLSPGDAPMIAMEGGDFFDFTPDNIFRHG